ncbi:MAG: diguanylate cyclase [Desulfarculales bacterium]|jgi:diguanylate cyclase (GGDEF)-like protein|nr:diguanylate cyclase [Desulfarculales bacterium]
MDEKKDRGKFRLMVVDDEKINLDVLRAILQDDYELQMLKSGREALALASAGSESKPDLILLDIIMPEMDGFTTLIKLKEAEPTRNIPVIFITGLSSAGDEEKGLRLGAVDYIVKPFSNEVVKARINTQIKIIKYIKTIERLGLIDELTDIPNRRYFDNRIDEEWRRMSRTKTPLSILMMDVDKFKNYNDAYGHLQGDALLRSLAKTMVSCLRRPADMVARLGGEDFAIILPGVDIEGALVVAEKVRAAVEASPVLCPALGLETHTTVSIGVAAVIPSAEQPLTEFIALADKNLYAAKGRGRNKVVA